MNLFAKPKPWSGGDVAHAVTLPKPPVSSGKLAPRQPAPTRDDFMSEYAELAGLVGVPCPDDTIEAFKAFLRAQDWGVFSLPEVIAYMDKKAAAESKDMAGWHWCPLREKDNVDGASFGTQGSAKSSRAQWEMGASSDKNVVRIPASDFYVGPADQIHYGHSGSGQMHAQKYRSAPSALPYDKTVPLHALRKVAKIEKEFPKKKAVSFFVCDYAPAPHIEYPDPFLMAVIKNDKLASGVGRFILDFWDEPGFGMEQMLA